MIKKTDLKFRFIFLAITVVCAFLCVFPVTLNNSEFEVKNNIHLGLDLRGGMYVLLNADLSSIPENKRHEAMAGALEKIRSRIDSYGVSEVSIEIQGDNSVLLEIPGMVDRTIIDTLQGMGKLEFKIVDSDRSRLDDALHGNIPAGYDLVSGKEGRMLVEKDAAITGADLAQSSPTYDMYGSPMISLQFNSAGGKKFAKVTEENVGRQLAILLDNKVMSAPVIKTAILDGRGVIEGEFNMDEARALVSVLNSGALPVPLTLAQERSIGPSLGSDSIKHGINSSLLGAGLVIIFMIGYYLLAGTVAVTCALLNILYTLAGLNILHGTLTLPGIAGIILTLGMAVDANVLIYERIREELNLQKPLSTAIKLGFERAQHAIIDTHVTTLIASLVLFIFGTGPIKGFAITLFLGVSASYFTAIFVGRSLFTLMLNRGLKQLPMMHLFSHKTNINFVKWRNVCLGFSIIVIIAGFVALNARKDKIYGVDFVGGQVLEYRITPPASIDEVRSALSGSEFQQLTIQDVKDIQGGIRIRGRGDFIKNIEPALKSKFKNVETLNVNTISPKVGKVLKSKAIMAIFMSLIGILIYVSIRFKHFDFALAAVIALFHDILLALGFVGFFNYVAGYYQIDLLTVTALLTIAGYSMNDTIVVYDRIREIAPGMGKLSLGEIINVATNNTLSRTVITTFTALMAVLAIFLAGGEALKCFSFVLLVGFTSGVYSTVYIAAALVMMIRRHNKRLY